MHRIVAILILVLLSAWLPLQPVAALAMPFCDHGQQNEQVHSGAAHAGAHHASHDHDYDHGDEQTRGAKVLPGCNDCGPCHLACAPMLGVSPIPGGDVPVRDFHPFLFAVPVSLTLDQPHPPPLAL
ncbi:MAG: hypothetical protein KIS79_06575 [Burkholderiales bacterium]|nr:hypothetical protein [Burkholderiales bacterium]